MTKMLAARYPLLSTTESITQDIADWNDEKSRTAIADIYAEALEVLGADVMAQLRAKAEIDRARRRAEIDRALGRR